MFRDCVKTSLRSMIRHPVYALITVTGLAAGMACCLLIFLFVGDELRYDSWHHDADRIFRVAGEYQAADRTVRVAVAPGPLAPAIRRECPEVSGAVRLWRSSNPENVVISAGEKQFSESRFLYSEPDFFTIFSFTLVRGNPEEAIRHPFTVALTEETARKYFGNENPIGKKLIVNRGGPHEFTVTGVVRTGPGNSHIRFDFLASLSTLEVLQGYFLIDWHRADFYTYVLLPPGYSPKLLERKISGLMKKRLDPEDASRVKLFLQPLTSIHLHSRLEGELERNGDIADVYLFSAIALFVLFVACINYMNLSAVYLTSRLREVAVRKIIGADRKRIVLQFVGESVVTVFLSFLLALFLAE
ncbi:MAG: ABC transporter permease, partial [Candidatus Latescibacterota bacterium]